MIAGCSNSRINHFYIELNERWTNLAKNIKDVNKEKPIISLKCDHLMILYKTGNTFRTTKRYLDLNTKTYTTLHSTNRKKKSVSEASFVILSFN